MPTVSIIIPNYNYARFLPERIGSILNQTFGDFEIIFLDDASHDESIAVFQDQICNCAHDVRLIADKVNSGSPFKQWNKGVALARGKYLWIAEADDSCEPTFLETLVAVMEANPQVVLAYTQSRPVDEHGQAVDGQYSYHFYTDPLDSLKWKLDYIQNGIKEVLDHLLIMNTIPNVSATLIRRSVYEQVNGAPENFRLSGDWMLYLNLLFLGDIAFHSRVLNRHRKHHSTITSNTVVDLTYFRELVRVQSHIRKTFPLEKDHNKMLAEKFFRDWMHLANGPFGRIPNGNLIRLFLIALRHYPGQLGKSCNCLARTLLA